MRFEVLDSWRGLAAMTIVVLHLTFYLHVSHVHFEAYMRGAYVLVDFFFVLSGFVAAHSRSSHVDSVRLLGKALVRRIGRIWPLHIAVLAAFVALEGLRWASLNVSGLGSEHAAFTGATSVSSMVAHIFLVQALNLFDVYSWNIPSWSLCVEFWVYAVFVAMNLWKSPQVRRLAPVFVLGSMVALFVVVPTTEDATFRWGIFRGVAGFYSGTLVYQAWLRLRTKTLPYASALEIAAVIGSCLFMTIAQLDHWSLLAAPFFSVILLLFVFEAGIVSRLLKSAPLKRLGTLSYAIYMTHYLFINATNAVLTQVGKRLGPWGREVLLGERLPENFVDWLPFIGASVVVAIATAIASVLAVRWIERPAQRVFNALADRFTPPEVEPEIETPQYRKAG